MKILLIEDNQKTIEWVRQGLTEAGYVVDYACDGRDGLHRPSGTLFIDYS